MRDEEKVKAAIQLVSATIPAEVYNFYEGDFSDGWIVGWVSSSWALFTHPTLAGAYELTPVASYTDGTNFIDIDEYKELVEAGDLPPKPKTPALIIKTHEVGLFNLPDTWPIPTLDENLTHLSKTQKESVYRAHSYFILANLDDEESMVNLTEKSIVKDIFFTSWPSQIKLSKAFWEAHRSYVKSGTKGLFKHSDQKCEEKLLAYRHSEDFKLDSKIAARARRSLQASEAHKILFS